jgi:hypothetical protein
MKQIDQIHKKGRKIIKLREFANELEITFPEAEFIMEKLRKLDDKKPKD